MPKRILFLGAATVSAVLVGMAASNASAGTITTRLAAANGADFTFEDDSRDYVFDTDRNGFLGAGDVLAGYAKINQTTPPGSAANNSIYAVFSQTFGPNFTAQTVPGLGNRYSGSFIPTPSASAASLDSLLGLNSVAVGGFDAQAMIAFIEVPDTVGFSQDLVTVSLAGTGAGGKISSILDVEGIVAFTAGLGVSGNEFFAFESDFLTVGVDDFVAGGIGITDNISVSNGLGTFGAGLNILDNYLSGVSFNRSIGSTFLSNILLTNFGAGNLYDLAIVNGNYGGINQGVGGNVQGASGALKELNFVNNADLVVNARVVPVPEPTSMVAWVLLSGVGAVGFRRRKDA